MAVIVIGSCFTIRHAYLTQLHKFTSGEVGLIMKFCSPSCVYGVDELSVSSVMRAHGVLGR